MSTITSCYLSDSQPIVVITQRKTAITAMHNDLIRVAEKDRITALVLLNPLTTTVVKTQHQLWIRFALECIVTK